MVLVVIGELMLKYGQKFINLLVVLIIQIMLVLIQLNRFFYGLSYWQGYVIPAHWFVSNEGLIGFIHAFP